MLTHFLGDVMRISSGDFEAGEIGGMAGSQAMYLAVAIVLLIPIVMVFLSLTLKHPVNRWANIIVAIFLFAFNLAGFSGYPGAYERFLIVVGFVFNVLTVWYAWRWPSPERAEVTQQRITITMMENLLFGNTQCCSPWYCT